MNLVEIVHFAETNFRDLVEAKSTRTSETKSTCYYGRTTTTIRYWNGSRVIGEETRDSWGCRYYIRK
jgi:hypothetical protein